MQNYRTKSINKKKVANLYFIFALHFVLGKKKISKIFCRMLYYLNKKEAK
jgi:hypothetical protein